MTLHKFLVRALGAAAAIGAAGLCLAQPANDDCPAASIASLGAQVGTNTGATESVYLVNVATNIYCNQATWVIAGPGSQHDVFWLFTAPASADYTIDTCGSSFDTILSVHSACPATQANMVSCNDDSTSGAGNVGCTANGLNSRIPHVTLTAGTGYYLRVFGYNNQAGTINLTIAYVSASSLGSCCDAATCILSDATNCTATFAAGGSCTPNPCAGACCHPANQRCSLLPLSSCPAGDVFLGVGIVCTPNPCTSASAGVCCRGSTCNTSISAANCTGNTLAGAVHTASGSTCNAAANTATPCCYPDYNKIGGISVQDIFDFLNDWFAGSPYANFAGNGTPAQLNVQNIFDFLNAWFAGGC